MSTGNVIEMARATAGMTTSNGSFGARQLPQASQWGAPMALAAFASGSVSLPLAHLAWEPGLVTDIQAALSQLGLLDPPVDGRFGPVSSWALAAFCTATGLSLAAGFTPAIAKALLDRESARRFPLAPGDDFAGRVVRGMLRQGHWFARHPACFNIVYVEGCDPGGTPNGNEPNGFNDTRLVLACDDHGVPMVLGAWEGTTEPDDYWTVNPEEPRGAARIAYGQYKSWALGMHHAGTAAAHPALVQVADIVVHRDLDDDLARVSDKTMSGLFGIDQHWGYDRPVDVMRHASAGCLVSSTKEGHQQFMSLIRQDIRFVASNAYRFMTTVMSSGML